MKNYARSLPFALTLLVLISAHPLPAVAAPGDLDTNFAGTGKIRFTRFGGGYAVANATVVQSDGKLIMAGFGNGLYNSPNNFADGGDFLLARLNTNNVLDTSFGDFGRVVTQVSTNYPNYASSSIQAVAQQADGKIVAGGYSYQNTNYSSFTLVRYNTNGSLDTTFGIAGTGILTTDFGEQSQINAMLIDANSNIVVAGFVGNRAGFALARYTPGGTLDNTFGTLGAAVTAGTHYGANAVMEAENAIYAVGTGNDASNAPAFAVFRYGTNGVLDTSFGGTGKVFTQVAATTSDVSESANAVALQNAVLGGNNLIVVAGFTQTTTNGFQTVIRYNLNGSLDTSFGSGGIVSNTMVNPTNAYSFAGNCISLDVEGVLAAPRKITIGGFANDGTNIYFTIARFTATGALDTSFGTNSSGKTFLPLGTTPAYVQGSPYAMALQSSNFVLVGYEGLFEGENDFAAARFTASGLVDTNFGNNGFVLADVSDVPGAQATGVALQPDGKIVAGGISPTYYLPVQNLSQQRFALVRFNPDGSADAAFGTNGVVTTVVGTNNDSTGTVAIQPDGKILLAGQANDGLAIVRYNSDGSLDPSFGSAGVALAAVPIFGNPAAMALQTDGKIVTSFSGETNSKSFFSAARFTTNGALDASFGSGGVASASIGTGIAQAFGTLIQPDGKIVVSGFAVVGMTPEFALMRFNTNGSLDNSFGTSGRAGAAYPDGDYAFGQPVVAIQPDGRLVVAGMVLMPSIVGDLYGFGLARFATNGTLDASFGTSGEVFTEVDDSTDGAYALALQSNGKMVAVGDDVISPNSYYAVLRYNPDGSLDNSFGSSGEVVTGFADNGGDVPAALALDTDGRAVVAGNANGAFGVMRLLGDAPSISLRISLTSTNTARISWPYPSAGWTLQQNGNLLTGTWVTPPETVNNDGTNNFIIVNPPVGNLFFRLKQ